MYVKINRDYYDTNIYIDKKYIYDPNTNQLISFGEIDKYKIENPIIYKVKIILMRYVNVN